MSPNRRAVLIYNPLAGPAEVAGGVAATADFWRQRGWSVSVVATRRAGHATELARAAAADGIELALAAGGDGTLSEVAAGLAHTDTVLGPLPSGTANSFALELGLPRPAPWRGRSLLPAAAALAEGCVQRMDLGRCSGGRHWLLWSGAGLDGFLVDRIEPRSKGMRRLGRLGYVAKAIWTGFRFPGMRASVAIDGQMLDGNYLMASVHNARRYAGDLYLNPSGCLDDGRFEVWLFDGQNVVDAFRHLLRILLRRHEPGQTGVQMVNGRSVTIDTQPAMPYHTDGDPGGRTPFSVTIEPEALAVLVPPTAPADLFRRPGRPL